MIILIAFRNFGDKISEKFEIKLILQTSTISYLIRINLSLLLTPPAVIILAIFSIFTPRLLQYFLLFIFITILFRILSIENEN